MATPDTPAEIVPDDWSRPLAERQLALLGRLAEVGLEIAVGLEAQVKSGQPFDGEAVARAYARTARAVRLTVTLQSKLIEDLRRWKSRLKSEADVALRRAALHAASHAARDAEAFHRREDDAKIRAHRVIRRLIRAEHDDIDRIERLDTEACERLDDEDLYGFVSTRPMSQVVESICKDLGLNPDWSRLAEEAWAKEAFGSDQHARPPPPAGEGLGSVPANDLASMRAPATGGLGDGGERAQSCRSP